MSSPPPAATQGDSNRVAGRAPLVCPAIPYVLSTVAGKRKIRSFIVPQILTLVHMGRNVLYVAQKSRAGSWSTAGWHPGPIALRDDRHMEDALSGATATPPPR